MVHATIMQDKTGAVFSVVCILVFETRKWSVTTKTHKAGDEGVCCN